MKRSGHRRSPWRKLPFLAGFLCLGLLAGACNSGGGDAATDTTSPSGTSGEAAQEGEESTLAFGIAVDMDGLDGNSLSDRPGRFVRSNAYATLTKRDADNLPVPNVLTDWEYDQENFTWTLTMRDDIVFHNGEAATSEDLKATFDRISNPDYDTYEEWWNAEETVIVDDYTVALRMNDDNPLAMTRADGYYLYPKSWIDEVGPDLYTGREPPPGSGPYRLVEWRQDDQIIMEATDDHWEGRPPIDNLIFRIVPDPAARVAGMRAGELDVAFPIPPALATGGADIDVHTVPSVNRARLLMDTREAPFDDIRVREALNLAIDRESIIEELLPDANLTPNMLVDGEVAFNPDLPRYDYDPDRARELLAEAGYPDGFGPMELSVSQERLFSGDEHLVVAQQLAEIGVELDIRVYPPNDFDTRLVEDNMGPLIWHGHSGGSTWHGAFTLGDVQPCGESGVSEHEEHWHYCNTEAADVIAEAIAIWASDQDRSIELFQEADRMLLEDHSMVPLWQPVDIYLLRSTLDWAPNEYLNMADASWTE